jgi:DNA polymerase-3 subunit delta'
MPFRDVIGHRRIVELLSRSAARDSLPPSLIFAGPADAAKRLTARAVAQALNCPSPLVPSPASRAPNPQASSPRPLADAVDACGVCATCARIARNVHPDVLVVEPGDMGSIKIEQVRDVVERVAYRPFEGRRRIIIIDEADRMVSAAQNALLKTLEEPPSSSIFILITSRIDVLLPTVRSRCIRLWFAEGAPLETDVEARDVAQRVLAFAAATADPRRRIDAAKQLLENTGSGGASDRAQVAVHLQAMSSLLRDVELVATRADTSRLANADVKPALDRLAASYHGDRGLHAFAAVDQALAALDRNVGVKSVADWLVLEL